MYAITFAWPLGGFNFFNFFGFSTLGFSTFCFLGAAELEAVLLDFLGDVSSEEVGSVSACFVQQCGVR